MPNGVCWTKDGFLIVVEHNRVLNFPAAEFFYEGPDVAVIEVVPQGKLIPPEEESFNHGARTCRIGADNKLYITLGQPFNVQPRDKLALYTKVGIGGIVRMNAFDGTGARSTRPACATRSAWTSTRRTGRSGSPTTRPTAWATTSRPARSTARPRPAAVLRLPVEAGQDAHHRDRLRQGHAAARERGRTRRSKTDAHAADLGMAFYTGKQFPAKYQGGFFSAQHGSWNRTKPIGARGACSPR